MEQQLNQERRAHQYMGKNHESAGGSWPGPAHAVGDSARRDPSGGSFAAAAQALTLLIVGDIRAGLLLPVGAQARASSSYWLVTSPELAESESLTALRSWLSDQIGRTTRDA